MPKNSATENDRLLFIEHSEERAGPLGDCAPKSANWEVSKVAIFMTMENFDPYVYKSAAILNDPELFAVADQVQFLLGELMSRMTEKELVAEGLPKTKRRRWKLEFFDS